MVTPIEEYSRREPAPTVMDNIETGILADFLKRWSKLGVDVEIDATAEDGTLYFIGGQGESMMILPDGSAILDINYH